MIKVIKKRSIFGKVFILMVIISIIAGALVLITAIREQTKFMKDSLLQENKLLTEVAAKSIEAGYFAGQWPFETLNQISESENVLFLWVVRPNGEIYLADDMEVWGKKIDDDGVGTREMIIKDAIFSKTGEKIKLIIYPLDIKELEGQWTLYVGTSLRSITAARNEMITYSIISFTMIIIIATILSFYLAKSFTKPIKELRDACDKVSMGDFKAEIYIKTNDEIEELARSFDRMVNTIQILKKDYEVYKEKSLEEERINPAYNEVANAIIKAVTNVVGPVALMLANQVPRLNASPYKVTIKGHPSEVIDELVEKYVKIMGPTAVTIAKKGISPMLEKNKDLDIPKKLR